MTPAVAIGNALSIIIAGIVVRLTADDKWNGCDKLLRVDEADASEMEVSPEMQAKRDHIEITNLGIGLFASCTFFAWGYIMAKAWNALVPAVNIHAYAWMIISVALCKIFSLVPENIKIASY